MIRSRCTTAIPLNPLQTGVEGSAENVKGGAGRVGAASRLCGSPVQLDTSSLLNMCRSAQMLSAAPITQVGKGTMCRSAAAGRALDASIAT